MKQLLTMMSLLVAGLMFLPSTASAGLVTIDNFSKTGDASLNGVDRMSSGHSFFFQGSGFVYAAPNVGTLEYTKNSGSFADLGEEFTLGVSADPGSMFLVSLLADGNFVKTQQFTGGASAFTFDSSMIGSASSLEFAITPLGSGALLVGVGGFTAFSAVPEPTSLALVGLACGGLALRRRRR